MSTRKTYVALASALRNGQPLQPLSTNLSDVTTFNHRYVQWEIDCRQICGALLRENPASFESYRFLQAVGVEPS